MRIVALTMALGMLLAGANVTPVQAQDAVAGFAAATQYFDISKNDADSLIGKLVDAQTRLRNGERVTFDLLSGAPAFYDANRVSPREAFLGLSLSHPFSIRKHPARDARGYRYQIEVLPNGTGQLLWEITVYLEQSGAVSRVEMFNRPPHPF